MKNPAFCLNVRLANSHLWFVYETAKDVSRRSRGGPSGDQYSWLVGVTDKIVQGLLQPNPKVSVDCIKEIIRANGLITILSDHGKTTGQVIN